jgi:hypothetical protein
LKLHLLRKEIIDLEHRIDLMGFLIFAYKRRKGGGGGRKGLSLVSAEKPGKSGFELAFDCIRGRHDWLHVIGWLLDYEKSLTGIGSNPKKWSSSIHPKSSRDSASTTLLLSFTLLH